MKRILVWDWPVRIGHWLMAGGFALAWLTAESESMRLVHIGAGACVIAAALFRLPWGLIGSRYARFADFVHGPQAVLAYLGSLADRRPQRHIGHNPVGGWAIVVLLALALTVGASGWLTYTNLGGRMPEELHETLATMMLAVVLIHIAGVIGESLLHRENLLRAMLTGKKDGEAADGIASARPLAAIALVVWIILGVTFAINW